MMNVSALQGDALIMHSLSSYKQTAEFIQKHDYKMIHSFLDNNASGQKHTDRFQSDFGTSKLVSQSSLFFPYEDLNDALKANQIPDFSHIRTHVQRFQKR